MMDIWSQLPQENLRRQIFFGDAKTSQLLAPIKRSFYPLFAFSMDNKNISDFFLIHF